MRYFMFSLTACVSASLLACGDADNPVVPTAPAGKATVDLSAEECAAAESLPDGILEQVLAADPNLDTECLLSTWQAYGCADWFLWGLSWMASLDAEVIFEIEVCTPPTPAEPERGFSHQDDSPPSISEARIPSDASGGESEGHNGNGVAPPPQVGELSTVAVSGWRVGSEAVFIFTRSGGHEDEYLSVGFVILRKNYNTNEITLNATINSGFRPGNLTFTHKVPISSGERVFISLTGGGRYLYSFEEVSVSF